MLKTLLNWLKSLYYTPANATQTLSEEETIMSDSTVNNSQADISTAAGAAAIHSAASTLLTGGSVDNVTTADTATAASDTAATTADTATAASDTAATTSDTATAVDDSASDSASASATPVVSSPLADFKARVQEFAEFVEKGIEVLGKEAEAELVALKEKYL